MAGQVPIFRTSLQARLLALLLTNPDRTWRAPEIAARLGTSPVNVQRELRRAVAEGLLTRESVGRTFLYRAATESPLYDALRTLLERTVGVESELREALKDMPGVQAAFLHGSYAQGTRISPESDVDVLVLGSPNPHELRKRLRDVEQRVGREIDVLAYTPDEFAALARAGNSFANQILKGPVQPLVGSLDDLPRAA
jgi:predicted nucleotidyltransferase